MRRGERIEFVCIPFRAQQCREVVDRHLEAPRIVELGDEANVGARGRIAEQELAGVSLRHGFKGAEALADPMGVPTIDLLLRVAELVLQIFEDPKIVEGVDVAGDGHRHCNDVSAFRCRGGNEWWHGISYVEIIDDRHALSQPVPVDLEHGHEPLRGKRTILRRLLLVGAQVHLAALIFYSLEVQRDPHAVGGGRSEIIVKNDPAHGPSVYPSDRNGAITSDGTRMGRPSALSIIAQCVCERTQTLPSGPVNSTKRSERAPRGASPTQVRAKITSPS